MKTKRMVVSLLLVLCLLASPTASALAAVPIVLPQAQELTPDEMEDIRGEGWLGALAGAVLGAVGGAATYVIDYTWDSYVDGEDRDWSWSDLGKSTSQGTALGIIGGIRIPF